MWSVVFLVHVLGFTAAVDSIFRARTPQGALAWAAFLVVLPYVALPVYAVFGQRRFDNYERARQLRLRELSAKAERFLTGHRELDACTHVPPGRHGSLARFGILPFCGHNHLKVLSSVHDAYLAMDEAISGAQQYLLVQFFIFRDDAVGRRYADCLKAKARQGVQVYMLYDDVGCFAESESLFKDMAAAGVRVLPFNSRRRNNPWQLNFRNHRKLVLADGKVAITGGPNIGLEHLGLGPYIGASWRDTALRVRGPAVQGLQLAFLEDWFWASGDIPDWNWEPEEAETPGTTALVLATGPNEEIERCKLFFLYAIGAAKKRIWITTPYFASDSAVISALKLAALRGVDVRLLLPGVPDKRLPYLASHTYVRAVQLAGVRVYRHPGFSHQKVLLVDDDLAAVGSMNLDNRSFRLNFESTVVGVEDGFTRQIAAMLTTDFARATLVPTGWLDGQTWFFRLLVRLAWLSSPLH